MSPSSPEAKPAQPKDTQDPSRTKDLVASDASDGEQEKQPVKGATAKVEDAAPSSEKPPLLPSDSTAAPTTPDPEKGQDPTIPTTTAGVPAEPGSRVPDAQERWRKRRLLIIHTRLARLFTWILLLGFVILPSTFTKEADNQQNPSTSSDTGGSNLTHSALNHIANLGLFAIGYVCCLINGFAICCLWYLRKDETEWLFTNLFSAGLINAFSGLITTLVNVYAVQNGTIGSSTKSTLILVSFCTFVYAVLTAVYARKRLRARQRRGSRASSAMV